MAFYDLILYCLILFIYQDSTLQETNISPKNGILKMIFLFPRWDMLIPWRVYCFYHQQKSPSRSMASSSPPRIANVACTSVRPIGVA